MYETTQTKQQRVAPPPPARQQQSLTNSTHSQINRESRVSVSSLRKKSSPTLNENISSRTKTKCKKYNKEMDSNDEDLQDEQHSNDEEQYIEEDNTDMDSPTMIESCHEQVNKKTIFSSLREMQAEMKNLTLIQDDLLQSSHDENSDISVLMDEEIRSTNKKPTNNRKQVVIEEYCDTEDDQIENNTDIEDEYISKKLVHKPAVKTVNQLLEKHRRENEQRKKQGATPFTLVEICPCSGDESTQIELTETEDNVNTINNSKITVKASTDSTKIPPKTIVSEIAQQIISENQSQKKSTSSNVTFSNPEPVNVSPIIAPTLQSKDFQSSIKKQRPQAVKTKQMEENEDDDRLRVEKKKRDLEKDVLLRDYERRLRTLSNQIVEYEALLEAHEERTSAIEREKDLELQALRDLYEEKWIEFKQKEKEWNDRMIAACNESTDLSSKTKKQNEQILQLRQKLQSKTDESSQYQKQLKEKEVEWKEKEKSYVNIRKRYDELLNHSREIKKHAEQLGTEVNDLRKYNEEMTQKLEETVKNHKSKSKELKEKNEKLTIQIQQQHDTLEALSKKIEEERRVCNEKEEKIKELERESKDMLRNYQELRQTLVNLSNEKENMILQEEEKFNQRVKELLKSESQLRDQKLESEKRIEEYEAKFLNLKKTVEEQLDQYKIKYEEERKRSKKLQLIAEKQKSKFSEEYEKLKDQIMKREKMFEEKINELKKTVENERKEKERLQRRCEHLESINNVMNPSPNINGGSRVTRESSKSRDSEVRETSDSIKPLFRKVEPEVASPKLNETNQSQVEDVCHSSEDLDSSSSSLEESECGSTCSTIRKKKRRFKRAVEELSKQKISPCISHPPKKDQNKEEEFNSSSTVVVRRKKEEVSQLDISGTEDTDNSNTHSITRLKDFEKLQEECNNEFKDYKHKMMELMKDINHHGKELGQLRTLVKNTTPVLSKQQPKQQQRAPSIEPKKKKVLKSGSPLKKKK